MPKNFITNHKTRTLKKRLEQLIDHSQQLKFLVGFFYFSGWQELYQSLKTRDDLSLKILVGLDVDRRLGQTFEYADPQADTRAQDELAERFFTSMERALNDEALDTAAFYEQVRFFLQLIQNGRLEIKKTFAPNHAKLYLFQLNESAAELTNAPGRFITGSSNLTRAGLLGQQEFNVEIGDYGWQDAEAYFDDLWQNAVPVTQIPQRKTDLLARVRARTQVAEVTPFEAYTLVIKTWLDLMAQKTIKPYVLRLLEEQGYTSYRYQLDAVNQALTIIQEYRGVIIADVVGLGKSVIAGMLARHLGGRGLVICPPALMGDKNAASGWRKYLHDFHLFDWEVRSVGDLENTLEYLQLHGDDVQTVIVDEAHRFRNEDTAGYELLSAICKNRNVILLTATPFNNAPADIFALLKLFIPPGKSTITLDDDLATRFARYNRQFRRLSYIIRYHNAPGEKGARAAKYYEDIFGISPPVDLPQVRRRAQLLAEEIRAVLEPVIIRRNRLDLKNDPLYAQEMTNLSEVADPQELFFALTRAQSQFYDTVVNDYFGEEGRFTGAIYQPYSYEKSKTIEKLDEEGNRVYLQQRNLYDFMRRLLVKRFESSFGAFAQSIQNFIRVHKNVLTFIENSGGRYILNRKLLEKIYGGDAEEIDAALEEFSRELESKEELNPRHDRIYVIDDFDRTDEFRRDIQADLNLLEEIAAEIAKLDLVAQDPKVSRLLAAVRDILNAPPATDVKRRKVVIFTEYLDTVRHARPFLEKEFPGRVLSVEGNLTQKLARQLLANFDAGMPAKKQADDFDVLLTGDKLSEGVNLNRAGAIINYDIPWNPTRVIQRVGRINRIGQKVFETLYIYNFFPTEQGADIVHSREIAGQKMFLIHNTLGEDAKIFDPDETPSPAELFRRVNRNPEEEEEESLLTSLRKRYFQIVEEHPDVIRRVAQFPARVKTAKAAGKNQLLVFRRKGLGLFTHAVDDTRNAEPDVTSPLFEDALTAIACQPETPRLPLGAHFWSAYQAVKEHREAGHAPASDNAVAVKARNNLQSALKFHKADLAEYVPFMRTLLRDMRDFQTLPKYTLRRLTKISLDNKASAKKLAEFKRILADLRHNLGEDYLERIEQRLGAVETEIIIAVENQNIAE